MYVEIDADGRLEADVAIVGAGLAGLMAARVVAAAGLKPIVLEARQRIGGRMHDEIINGDVVLEMGRSTSLPRTRGTERCWPSWASTCTRSTTGARISSSSDGECAATAARCRASARARCSTWGARA